ncbi:MAG: T9SS type A sorting domain-containing protein [Bacteroidia bacterium]
MDRLNLFKCQLFILFLIGTGSPLLAQFTLQRKHYFTIGNVYPCNYISVPLDTVIKSGQNVVWDFSNSVVLQPDSVLGILPDTTIFFNDTNTNYNLANLGLWEPNAYAPGFTDNFYTYLLEDTSSINYLGDWADNGLYELWYNHFTDPKLRFHFPMNYGDSIFDTFDGAALAIPLGWHRNFGTRSIKADGYGDVIINGTVHSNCLRIRVDQVWYDSAMFTFNTYYDLEYYWFDPLLNGVLLEAYYPNIIGVPHLLYARYFYANPLVVNVPEQSTTADVRIYPNPAQSLVHLEINGDVKILRVELSDMQGRLIRSMNEQISGDVELSVLGLNSGTYLLNIVSDSGVRSRKLVIQ